MMMQTLTSLPNRIRLALTHPAGRSKLCGWLFAACVVLHLFARWQASQFPAPDDISPELLAEPKQTPTSRKPFTAYAGDVEYTITPLYNYEIHGMVTSCATAHSFTDIYHGAWNDYLNVKDLALIWGGNVSSGIYRKLKFRSDTWTAWVQTKSSATYADWQRFSMTQMSNNHLISDDPDLLKLIHKTGRGDQVRIVGMLAEYSHDGGFHRGSSTSRTDTGNGACETVFVEEFEVLQWSNLLWRRLRRFSIWLAVFTALGALWFHFRRPINSY